MTSIFQLIGVLIAAVIYGIIAQVVAQVLHRTQAPAALGMYRAILLDNAPDEWQTSLIRFILLFSIGGIARFWIGPLGPLLLPLAWIGYNVFRTVSSPQEAPQPASEGKGLQFTLRTTSGPNVRLANPFRGTFIAGGAGSGKSKSIIEPILQQAGVLGLTGVVYDFKFPTLAEEVAGSYAGTAVTPYFVNFTDLSRSHRVNPLAPQLLATASFAREAATTIITNLDAKAAQQRNFWIQSGEVLLAGCIWYLRRNHPEQCSLPAAVSMILEADAAQLLATLQRDEEVRGLIASIASASKSENTIAGVFSTIQNYLAVLNTPEIFWVMSGDQVPFDLNTAATPGVLVVGNDPALSSTFSPLISLIVATAIKRLNQQGRLPSLVLLDEAPTLFIPNFAQLPATARSNQVATVYAVQDVAQMEALTSRQEAEMILANLGNQFWGRTTNTATAERVSKMFGKVDREYRSTTAGKSKSSPLNIFKPSTHTSSTSMSVSIQQRDKLEAQQVMRFGVGEFAGLVVESGQPEFRSTFRAEPSKAQPIAPFQEASAAAMVAKIPSSGKGLSQRTGSSGGLVAYLEKEVQGQWFSLDRADVPAAEVTQTLDHNKRNLNRDADKYYQVILAPSQTELRHIGSDPEKLRAYTRAAMEQYAANFGKGIEGRDLVYFAKVEHERTTNHQDRAVQLGDVEKGEAKEGPQAHIHIIVSRTENLARYSERKQAGELDRKNPYHLSPLTNHKNTQRGVVTGGFERKQYSERVEQAFDQAFAYERPLTEMFRYAHTMQHGTPEECAALRVQAIQEQQRQAVPQAAPAQQAAVQPLAPEQRPPLAIAAPAPVPQEPNPPQQQAVPEPAAPEQRRVRGPRL